jgi:threonine/homoserine efflux transporter RhtA
VLGGHGKRFINGEIDMAGLIPTRIHGVLDYLLGLVLIASPWLFGFDDEGTARWVPIIIGAGVLLYSLLTDYELGAVRAIPMSVHLLLDFAGGVVLAASPWLFGFNDEVWVPHLVLGLVEIGTALLTERHPERNEEITQTTTRRGAI